MVTFHQNTNYEDFVEGIRPVLTDGSAGTETPAEREAGGDVRYELSRGVFRRIAERAASDPNGRYVLVIDEIEPRQRRPDLRRADHPDRGFEAARP